MLLVLIVVGAILMGFAIWFGTVGLMGLAGWRALAAAYPAGLWPEAGEGVALRAEEVQVGSARYRGGSVQAALTERGLYLRPGRPFAVTHPTVFAPWAAMAEVRALGADTVEVVLEGAPRLALHGDVARFVLEASAADGGGGARRGALDLPDEDAPNSALQEILRAKVKAG